MNEYADLLRARLLRLVKLGQELKALPLEDVHRRTGLRIFQLVGLVADAYGITENELRERSRHERAPNDAAQPFAPRDPSEL